MTQCQSGQPVRQVLYSITGEREVALTAPLTTPPAPPDWCGGFGAFRAGFASVFFGFLQRLGVSPDGRTVVFEVSDDFARVEPLFDWRGVLPPEQEGIFRIQADGSGLRRLGDASRAPWFRFQLGSDDIAISEYPGFAFSPDGSQVAYTDRGSDDTFQIFTMQVDSGTRRQVTCLGPIIPIPGIEEIVGPLFVDDETILFGVPRSADDVSINSVKVHGSCEPFTRPPPVSLPGARFVPAFAITGADRLTYGVLLPGITPVNPICLSGLRPPCVVGEIQISVQEIVVETPGNVLQLTNFRRVDTGSPVLSADGTRVVFNASVNLDDGDRNPHHTCQFFSVDALGGPATQLTDFKGTAADAACIGDERAGPDGCLILQSGQDLKTDALLFYSTCDLSGAGPKGGQIFAMRSDGSGLRQLTSAAGLSEGPDAFELPGPFAYSPAFPRPSR